MTLLQVKCYEAEFLGMPLEREKSEGGKKGKLIRSKDNTIFADIGELDADRKVDQHGNVTSQSPTYGKRVCKVGETYKLTDWQLSKYGGAFDVEGAKEVKGFTIDDRETPEEANIMTPEQVRAKADALKKIEEKKLSDKIAKQEGLTPAEEKKRKKEEEKAAKEAEEAAKKDSK